MKEINFNEPLKYKQICEIMEEDQIKNSSKGKQLQLKRWQQYYDIEKIGTYYFIKKKYEKEEIELIENSGKYTSYITDRLLEYLYNSKKETNTISYYGIYELTYMVNKKYHTSKNNMYDIEKRIDEINKFKIDIGDYLKNELNVTNSDMIYSNLNSFFRVSSKLLKQNVQNALNSMQKKGLILYRESFILNKKPIKVNVGDKEEIIQYPPHICTDKEDSIMLDLQDEARKYVGVNSKKELYFTSMETQSKYYNYLLKRIKETFGYDSYTSAVKIVQGIKAVSVEYLKFNKSLKINENTQKQFLGSKEMNQKVMGYLCEQFVDEYVKK